LLGRIRKCKRLFHAAPPAARPAAQRHAGAPVWADAGRRASLKDKTLRKLGVPKAQWPCKPAPNPRYPTKQQLALHLLEVFKAHHPVAIALAAAWRSV